MYHPVILGAAFIIVVSLFAVVGILVADHFESKEPKHPARTVSSADDPIVYLTRNGAHYHRRDCYILDGVGTVFLLKRSDAEKGHYDPCGRCEP